jgi:hypothetical protein
MRIERNSLVPRNMPFVALHGFPYFTDSGDMLPSPRLADIVRRLPPRVVFGLLPTSRTLVLTARMGRAAGQRRLVGTGAGPTQGKPRALRLLDGATPAASQRHEPVQQRQAREAGL